MALNIVYTCFRYPKLDIGGSKGQAHIRFDAGVFIATTKEEVELLEKNDWYGSLIQKRVGADELKAVRLAQETLAQGMVAVAGARGTRVAKQTEPEPEEPTFLDVQGKIDSGKASVEIKKAQPKAQRRRVVTKESNG